MTGAVLFCTDPYFSSGCWFNLLALPPPPIAGTLLTLAGALTDSVVFAVSFLGTAFPGVELPNLSISTSPYSFHTSARAVSILGIVGIPLRGGARVLGVRVRVVAVVLTLGLGLEMPFGRIAGLTPVIGATRPFVAVGLGARGSVEVGAGLLLAETVVFGLTVVLAAAPAFDGGLAFDDSVNVPVLALGPEFDTLARLAAVAALMPAAAPVLQDVAALTLALATVPGSIDILPLPTPGFALELVRVVMVDAAIGEAVFVG